MSKKIKALLAVVLCAAMLIAAASPAFAAVDDNGVLRFNKDGKLKIMQISDTQDIDKPQKETLALLEADVNFKVVKDFVKTVSERAVGAEVLDSLTPAQQVIKIVNEVIKENRENCNIDKWVDEMTKKAVENAKK